MKTGTGGYIVEFDDGGGTGKNKAVELAASAYKEKNEEKLKD
jgi:hypothetical protein